MLYQVLYTQWWTGVRLVAVKVAAASGVDALSILLRAPCRAAGTEQHSFDMDGEMLPLQKHYHSSTQLPCLFALRIGND